LAIISPWRRASERRHWIDRRRRRNGPAEPALWVGVGLDVLERPSARIDLGAFDEEATRTSSMCARVSSGITWLSWSSASSIAIIKLRPGRGSWIRGM